MAGPWIEFQERSREDMAASIKSERSGEERERQCEERAEEEEKAVVSILARHRFHPDIPGCHSSPVSPPLTPYPNT